MKRVSRRPCEDGPLLDEQETEGQRRLHGLLLQQLHTDADVQRCVAKRRSFAPAAVYRPFGEQAAGVRSLAQFQALQEGEQEVASLRELGLTDAEIRLWRNRDSPVVTETARGVSAAPGAKEQRLQVIRDKMAARAELLARPQRFASSHPLSRREMEIEQALFQGSDRLGFLSALYHRDEEHQDGQQGATPSDPMDSVYRDVLLRGGASGQKCDGSHDPQTDQSEEAPTSQSSPSPSGSGEQLETPPLAPPTQIDLSQPIGSLRGAMPTTPGAPPTVCGEIESISDEDILKNRESDEAIRSIPRFRNYEPGRPSKVRPTHPTEHPTEHPTPSVASACPVPGALREEPEPAGVGRPAGGAVLPLPAGRRDAARLPAADGTDERPRLHHAARRGGGPEGAPPPPRVPPPGETSGSGVQPGAKGGGEPGGSDVTEYLFTVQLFFYFCFKYFSKR